MIDRMLILIVSTARQLICCCHGIIWHLLMPHCCSIQYTSYNPAHIIEQQNLMEQLQAWMVVWLRPLVKYITHKLTGQTEIERVARANDLLALQKSILLSKQLAAYKLAHPLYQPYHPDLAKQLCAIKRIQDSDSQFRELYSWKYAIRFIHAITTTKYNPQSPTHEALLQQIWDQLRPGRAITGRKSNEWIELGFQGDDPATDFRGSGELGLVNLHGWVKTAKGKQVFAVADSKGSQYFFASASIFLTMLSVQLLKDNSIAASYWVTRQDTTLLQLFQRLFEAVFIQFDAFWRAVPDKSMMQFNSNLLQFSKQLRSHRLAALNQQLATTK